MRRDILLVVAILVLVVLVSFILIDVLNLGGATNPKGGAGVAPGAPEDPLGQRPRKHPDEISAEEARRPEVILFKDKTTYGDWYRFASHEPQVDLRPPEGVDFTTHQVVAVLWGDKPGDGHEISLKGVVAGESEIVVTVQTRAPDEGTVPLIVYPGLTVAVLRERRVRVVITGDKMRPVPKFFDFQASAGADLDVDVRQSDSRK